MTQPTPAVLTEKGMDVPNSVCPNCGTQLTSLREADHSVSVSACPKCYPHEAAASAGPAPASVPTETGIAPTTTTGGPAPAAQ
jgi:hypothetical protein